jgi:predicted aspartyl protease
MSVNGWQSAWACLAVAVLTAGCSKHEPPSATNPTAEQPWPPALLTQSGFVEVPLSVGKGRLFEVPVEVSGEKLLFLLDTGASYLVLDRTVADRLKLPTKAAPGPVGGRGTAAAAARVARLDSLRVGGFTSEPFEAWVMDLAAINDARTKTGDTRCDGLIGAAFLDHYKAVLDYPSRRLYLRAEPARRTDPSGG